MNVLQDLQNLLSQAQTDEAKAVLNAEIAKVQDEAKAAASSFETHVAGLEAEAKVLWAKIKAVL